MSNFKGLKFTKGSLLLILIIVVGFLLRVYSLPNNFYYTMDEEVMNLIQRRIVLLEHFPLIGSVSPLNTYLGPIFYYVGAFILFLSKLNPLGQSIFAILIGTFNIYFIYKVTKELFTEKAAYFASIIYSSSFLMVIFDRRYWHLSPGPILSLTVLLSLYKIKKGSIKYVYLLTAALIFGWNTDYTNLVLFLFVVIAWILFKLPVKKKEVLIATAIFILSNIPLALFDLRHDFLNSRALVSYFTKQNTISREVPVGTVVGVDRESLTENRTQQAILSSLVPIYGFSRMIYTASDLNISEQHTYCKEYIFQRNGAQGAVLPVVALLIILSFGYLTIKSKDKKIEYLMILSFYLTFQIGVLFYAFVFHGDIFEHYLSTLLPYFMIMTAVVLAAIYNSRFKFVSVLLITLFVSGNLYLIFNAYNPLSFNNKFQAASYALEQVGNEDFSLDSIGSCFRYDGFYYPFILQGRYPVKSYQDPNYSWLYNYEVADKHPKKVVVMVSRGEFEKDAFLKTYQRYQQWVIDRRNFGDIEVLILDNSKGNFH